jgi:shikimate kinase
MGLDCIIHLEERTTVSMLNTTIIRPKILNRERSKKTLRKLASERDAWLAQIPSWGLFHRIFDEIPNELFAGSNSNRFAKGPKCPRTALAKWDRG